MAKSDSRYEQIIEAVLAERNAEEAYFSNLSTSRSQKERIAAGVLWYPVEIVRKQYTIGEYVELELSPNTPSAANSTNNFKVGASAIFFVNKEEREEFKGTISYATRKKVRIILSADVLMKDHITQGGGCGIELIYDDRPYRVMIDAIKQVQKSNEPHIVELRQAISRRSIDHNRRREVPDIPPLIGFNPSQMEAIQGCHSVERIGIIHGPPGTGKTTTLIGLVQGLVTYEKKILVTAPSNNAVDLLAKLLDQKGIKVLRIGNVTRIGDNIAHLSLDEQVRNHKEWQHIKQVKIEAEQARREATKNKRKFGSQERENRSMLFKEARQLDSWARDLEDKLVESVIGDCQVVCTTLVGCAHKSVAHLRFETVIIDEGSQALEPECWTAILRAKRVIIAGDHHQLPPTVKSPEAMKLGLAETILDRMADHLAESFLLRNQYRMHPAILGFSNQEFYQGQLSTDISVTERLGHIDDEPLVYIDTSGCGFDEELNPQTSSRSNRQEYFILREHLLSKIDVLQDRSIGIISPYKEQVRLIRQEIDEDETLRALDIEVNSIDGFQGQEKDVIYISLVRSNDAGEIGFLKDYRRLNVAMTRARLKMIIIGDMATLGIDPVYLRMSEYVDAHGRYQSAWEYMGY